MVGIRMIRSGRWVGLVALGLIVSLGSGCSMSRVKQERDALYQQNQEFQSELAHCRSALDAAEADRASLQGEVQRLEMALATRPEPAVAAAPVPVEPVRANTGFGEIAGVETFTSPGQVHVRVPGDVLFESGKIELKNSARATLSDVARVLRTRYDNHTVRVEGYTDSDPIRRSKWSDNLELSLQRAAAVRRAPTLCTCLRSQSTLWPPRP